MYSYNLAIFYTFLDAVLGVEKCGLLFMGNKDVAHSGFPEVAFDRYAEVLVNMVSQKIFDLDIFLACNLNEIIRVCSFYDHLIVSKQIIASPKSVGQGFVFTQVLRQNFFVWPEFCVEN